MRTTFCTLGILATTILGAPLPSSSSSTSSTAAIPTHAFAFMNKLFNMAPRESSRLLAPNQARDNKTNKDTMLSASRGDQSIVILAPRDRIWQTNDVYLLEHPLAFDWHSLSLETDFPPPQVSWYYVRSTEVKRIYDEIMDSNGESDTKPYRGFRTTQALSGEVAKTFWKEIERIAVRDNDPTVYPKRSTDDVEPQSLRSITVEDDVKVERDALVMPSLITQKGKLKQTLEKWLVERKEEASTWPIEGLFETKVKEENVTRPHAPLPIPRLAEEVNAILNVIANPTNDTRPLLAPFPNAQLIETYVSVILNIMAFVTKNNSTQLLRAPVPIAPFANAEINAILEAIENITGTNSTGPLHAPLLIPTPPINTNDTEADETAEALRILAALQTITRPIDIPFRAFLPSSKAHAYGEAADKEQHQEQIQALTTTRPLHNPTPLTMLPTTEDIQTPTITRPIHNPTPLTALPIADEGEVNAWPVVDSSLDDHVDVEKADGFDHMYGSWRLSSDEVGVDAGAAVGDINDDGNKDEDSKKQEQRRSSTLPKEIPFEVAPKDDNYSVYEADGMKYNMGECVPGFSIGC